MQFLFLFKENGNLHIEQEKVVLTCFFVSKLIISFIIIIMYFYSASIQLPAQERFYE